MLPPVDYSATAQLLKLKPGIHTHTLAFCSIHMFNQWFWIFLCSSSVQALSSLLNWNHSCQSLNYICNWKRYSDIECLTVLFIDKYPLWYQKVCWNSSFFNGCFLQGKDTSTYCEWCSRWRRTGANRAAWLSGSRSAWAEPSQRSRPCRAPWPREPLTTRTFTQSCWEKSAKQLIQKRR